MTSTSAKLEIDRQDRRWRTRVITWDRSSMASARAVRKILDESAAWRAFVQAFGPMHRGLAWVEVNRCRAIIGFGSQGTGERVSPIRVYEVGPHGVRRRIRGRRQFLRRLTLDD